MSEGKRVPKCRAQFARVVRVEVKGEPRDQRGHELPVLPDMDDLHRKIGAWLTEHGIYPAFYGSTGGGSWTGYFWEKDAERFIGWLGEQPELAHEDSITQLVPPAPCAHRRSRQCAVCDAIHCFDCGAKQDEYQMLLTVGWACTEHKEAWDRGEYVRRGDQWVREPRAAQTIIGHTCALTATTVDGSQPAPCPACALSQESRP